MVASVSRGVYVPMGITNKNANDTLRCKMQGIKRELLLPVLLLILLFIAYTLIAHMRFILIEASRRLTVQQSITKKFPPPLTPAIIAQLKKSHGFQMLVSYTDRGFEPAITTIKVGNTVRFTNNSSHKLWIAAKGTSKNSIYPGTSDCGESALDSCIPLNPGDFWEFTFTQSGTWTYQNNLDKNDTAIIHIQ